MRLDTARRFALSLPETTEEPHFDMSSLLRRAKLRRPSPFFPGDSTRLQWHMRLHPWLAQWLDASPGRTGGSGRSFHFRNDELLEEAWRAKAPKRVLAAYDASR